MTPIADMVEQMLADGVSHATIVLAVRTVEVSVTALVTALPAALPEQRTRNAIKQANYRAKLKQIEGVDVACMAATQTAPPPVTPVTQPVTLGNAVTENVTFAPLSKKGLSIKKGEEEESKKEEPSKLPRARGTRLPDEWLPSEVDVSYAIKRGMRPSDIEIEATKFRNYWTNRTDRLAAKPRWDRAWQNWILGARQGGQRNGIAARGGIEGIT